METNPFRNKVGTNILKEPYVIFGFILTAALIGFILVLSGVTLAFALLAIPILLLFVNKIFVNAAFAMTVLIVIDFTLLGLTRYIPITIGYVLDIYLLLLFLAYFFNHFYTKVDFKPLKNDLVYLSLIWFGYIVMEIANPEAVSTEAWFSSMRGEALYMIMVIPLVYLIFNKPKYLDLFMYIWGIMTILAFLKGIQQLYLKPDFWEQKWLDDGAYQTHVLWGKLRIFSFFTDASQFGASQGQSGVLGILLYFNTKNYKKKIFWLIVGLTGLYSMMISGTRGAIAVPLAGFALYIILKKNIKIIIVGGFVLASVFVFFKFTTIANDNYQINRMRTAFNPKDDASMNLRLLNQRKFAAYLKNRPIGGGVGHAGNRAQKFVPYGYLANIATDSWFVMIWAECGIVGLFLHLFILFYILGKSIYIVMFRLKNKELIAKLGVLLCCMFGIIAASYSNMYLGQFPTHILLFTSMAYIFLGVNLEKQLEHDEKEKLLQNKLLTSQ